jgi:formylmethanofuran dehydrogenase subunit E
MLCPVPKNLLREAEKFHGHLGAFLVLGLKAGLYSNEILGKDLFVTHARVETESTPPRSCFVDGIQLTTGCTMGKRNIELMEGDSLSVTFTKNNRQLTLRIKPALLKELTGIASMGEGERAALRLVDKPVEDLFDTSSSL